MKFFLLLIFIPVGLNSQQTKEDFKSLKTGDTYQLIIKRPKGFDSTKAYHHVTAIGSGGNINKIFSISKRKEGKPLTLELLRDYYKEFSNLSMPQRMSVYKLREDRADVIVPALLIYINVMRWADAEEIFVPKIGLADGLIHTLYEEVKLKEIEI